MVNRKSGDISMIKVEEDLTDKVFGRLRVLEQTKFKSNKMIDNHRRRTMEKINAYV